MIKPTDLLNVFYQAERVGRLVLNNQQLALFEYDEKWLKSGFSISPLYLPLKTGTFVAKKDPFEGLFGVFNDSLPDGWGRLLIDRYLREKGVDPRSLSVLDRLSLVGTNGMGALSYIPENSIAAPKKTENIDFLAKEIECILSNQSAENLELLIACNGSSAGVRPKVIVNYEGEAWLVKFPAQYDDPEIGKIEYEISILARKSGIEMSETRLFKGKYFGTKLFDRSGDKRFHVHSASGLLYASHRLPSIDYEDLMKLTLMITKDILEVEKMFHLMVFNVLINNRDDHSKNFSFIYKENSWRLSPAYDLTHSYGFNGNHSTTILGKGKPSEKDILDLAKSIGFPVSKAKQIVDKIKAIIDGSPCLFS